MSNAHINPTLKHADVIKATGLSRSTIARMRKDGNFPTPKRLSPRRIGWPANEIAAWIEGRERNRH